MTDERGNGGESIGRLKSDVEHNAKSISDIWSVMQAHHREYHAGLDAMEKRRSDGDEKLEKKIDEVKTELWKQRNELTRIITTIVIAGQILTIIISAAIKIYL